VIDSSTETVRRAITSEITIRRLTTTSGLSISRLISNVQKLVRHFLASWCRFNYKKTNALYRV